MTPFLPFPHSPSESRLCVLSSSVPGPSRRIRAVIGSHIDEIRWCYEQSMAVWPNQKGRVIIRFIISEDGSVLRSGVRYTEVPREVACCMRDRVMTWRFDAPDKGLVIVDYPFTLEPAEARGAR